MSPSDLFEHAARLGQGTRSKRTPWNEGKAGALTLVGALVPFKTPWNPDLFSTASWRWWVGGMTLISALAAVVIYAISEFTHRREVPTATPTPAG